MILSIPALSFAVITKKNSDLALKYSIGGRTIDGNIDTARILTTKIGPNFEHRYNPYIRFNFKGSATFETGTYERKTALGDGPRPTNRLSLSESTMALTPIPSIEIKAGAINQSELDSPMLLTSTAFLAAKEQIELTNENYGIMLFAEQAYAKNKDLSSTLPNTEEGLPKFFAEGAKIHFKNDLGNLNARIMHWAYDNLGAGIATESAFRGNTAITSGPAGFTGFKYKFMGLYAAFDFEIKVYKNHKIFIDADYVVNDKAPEGKNSGHFVQAGIGIDHGHGYFNLAINYRDIESDATPAYYSSFQNNQASLGGYIEWDDKEGPFTAKFEVAHFEEKRNVLYQSPENRAWFSIKSFYNFL